MKKGLTMENHADTRVETKAEAEMWNFISLLPPEQRAREYFKRSIPGLLEKATTDQIEFVFYFLRE